jgi:hypothetical protein
MTDTTTSPERKHTRQQRVAIAIMLSTGGNNKSLDDVPLADLADAAIEAYPDPEKPRKDPPPPLPSDACSLYALRGEFQEVYQAVMSLHDTYPALYPRAHALAAALLDQGVVHDLPGEPK